MKTLIKILMIAILTTTIYSQVKFGIKGGLNFSDVNVDESMESSTNIRTGLSSGLFFEFYTSKVTAIQVGVDYTQKGTVYENENSKITHEINYIEIPLQFNIKFTKSRFCPYMSAGMVLGFMTRSTQKQEYTSGEVYEEDTEDLYDANDFGFAFGVGIQYSISKNFDAFINCTRSLGTKNTFTDEAAQIETFSSGASNNGYQLTAGFKVRL
jgi:opacity protein-like surface antigen